MQKLMQPHGIRAKGKRANGASRPQSHDRQQIRPPTSPNLLDRQCSVAETDKVWAGDITNIATDEGWLFLAVVIELFSRQVVGWSLREARRARDRHRRAAHGMAQSSSSKAGRARPPQRGRQ